MRELFPGGAAGSATYNLDPANPGLRLTSGRLLRKTARQIASAALVLLVVSLVPQGLKATTIDFEDESAMTGPFLTGIPDSPLTIGIATIQGGELRFNEVGLVGVHGGVYASEGAFGSDSNPLIIQFSVPVSNFSVFVANRGNPASFSVSDDLGESASGVLDEPEGANTRVFSLTGSDITSVTIGSSDASRWSFAIDNITFTAASEVPEPLTMGLTALSLLGLAGLRRRCRRT